jgi:biopolymer transport protein ExbB/TolQ
MGAVEGALIVLIILQSIVMVIIAIALIVIFFSVKKGVDRVNEILSSAEDIVHGVKSATSSGLGSLLGKGLREAMNNFGRKKGRRD